MEEYKMSKIGKLNLDVQDQANALGYSSVQEVLDDGYEVNVHGELVEPETAAHNEWLKEKQELLDDLNILLRQFDSLNHVNIVELLDRTIKFIDGVKYE